MFAFGWSSRGRKPECPEETHLSDLVTTWPSHMPTPGFGPGSQRWESSALTLRQSDSRVQLCPFTGSFFCSGLDMWFLGFKECLQCFNVRTVKVCYWALLLVIETRIWDFDTLYLFQTSSTVQASTDYESDALPSAPHRPYVCKRTYHLGHLYSKITSIVCQNLYPLVSEMSSFQNVDISTL